MEKKSYATREKKIDFIFFYELRNISIFLLAGRKVHFIVPYEAKKSIFDPLIKKKIPVQHGKNIYFTRVVVTFALLGDRTSHSQNKFFIPSCIIYYFLLEGHKFHFISLSGSNNKCFPRVAHDFFLL